MIGERALHPSIGHKKRNRQARRLPSPRVNMQFNIERFPAALPPIEPSSPSGAASDRLRERESFDRHLEQARQQPADRDRRSTTEGITQSSANEAPPKPKDPPPKPSAEETSPSRPADGPSGNGSENKKPGDHKVTPPPADSVAGESKSTKKQSDKRQGNKSDDAEAEQLVIGAVATPSGDVTTQGAETVSDHSESQDDAVLSARDIGPSPALKPAQNAKAVAANAAVNAEIASPEETLPASDPSATAPTAAASATAAAAATRAAGADAALDVAPAAVNGAPAEASPDVKLKANSLPTAATASTDGLPTEAAGASEEASQRDQSPTTTSSNVNTSPATESNEATPGPRRSRAAKTSDGEKKATSEGLQQDAGPLVSPADQARLNLVSATADRPTHEAAAQFSDRTADHMGDRVGEQDASPVATPNSSTSGTSTDATLNPPAKLASAPSSRFASGGTEKGPAATDVERVRFVQRVAKAFQSAADRGGPLRLRLSPPELGALRLEITVRGGAMTARLEAETPAARTLLLDGLPALRERLAQQDINVERFDVDLMGQSPNDSPQTRDGSPNSHGQASLPPRNRNAAAAVAAPVVAPAANTSRGDGRLNVIRLKRTGA